MRRNQAINTIMTKSPKCVQVGQKLSEVRNLMQSNNFHHVPVVNGGKLVGLITSTDVLRVSYQYGTDDRMTDNVLDHTLTIEQVMTKEPIQIDAKAPIRRAVEILAEGQFHALPVVEDDTLVGMVTSTDLHRYLLDQY